MFFILYKLKYKGEINQTAGVYLIFCSKTNKYYIGSTENLMQRYTQHSRMLEDNRHHSIKLQEDWNKFGEDAFVFSVITECDIANARKQELELINSLQVEKYGYNSTGKQLKKITKKKDENLSESIMAYIKNNQYKPDGNIYCYELWHFIKNTVKTFKVLINYLRIDNEKNLWSYRQIDDDDNCIGMNYDSDGVFITICNRKLHNNKSQIIFVD